jgi:hypothetical protein
MEMQLFAFKDFGPAYGKLASCLVFLEKLYNILDNLLLKFNSLKKLVF